MGSKPHISFETDPPTKSDFEFEVAEEWSGTAFRDGSDDDENLALLGAQSDDIPNQAEKW